LSPIRSSSMDRLFMTEAPMHGTPSRNRSRWLRLSFGRVNPLLGVAVNRRAAQGVAGLGPVAARQLGPVPSNRGPAPFPFSGNSERPRTPRRARRRGRWVSSSRRVQQGERSLAPTPSCVPRGRAPPFDRVQTVEREREKSGLRENTRKAKSADADRGDSNAECCTGSGPSASCRQ
jgi:hypothetical protein